MPTDPSDGGLRAPRLSFRALALAVVLASLVLAAGLTVANARQGPRVRSTSVDPERVTTSEGQRWTIDLDQPVDPRATTVDLEPPAPHAVEVSGSRVSVRFERPLDLGTRYRLRLTVTGATRGTSSAVEEALTTPPPETFLLQRHGAAGSGGLDQVLRTDVRTGRQLEVFAGTALQEVAVAPPFLAVVQQGSDSAASASLQLVPTAGGSASAAGLPFPPGTVLAHLRGSGPGGLFGFVAITSSAAPGPDQTGLHVLDPTSGRTEAVVDPDGRIFDPLSWYFVPGTTQLVVQTDDGQVWLADPWNRTPARPLGAHGGVDGFVSGTKQLVVHDGDHRSSLDLRTGEKQDAPVPRPPRGQQLYASWEVGPPGPAPVLLSFVGASGDAGSGLVLAAGQAPVWSAQDGSSVEQGCTSPNGQYLALEVVPPHASGDGYPVQPDYLGARTVVVDLRRGVVSGAAGGGSPSWCR